MKISEAITHSAKELEQTIEQHRKLLDAVVKADGKLFSKEVCVSVKCPCRKELREVLSETIAVLDDTRRSFKSRQLAALRQKLIQVLAKNG